MIRLPPKSNKCRSSADSYVYKRQILNNEEINRITPVIILDEIHMASNKLREDLGLIFNFSMDSENPFILILAGQPLIRSKLALNVNNPLRQRIVIELVYKAGYCN